MKEIDEEIKLTLNLMQADIDDGAHDELQGHLYSLLEIKRNELQQRLVERSWSDHTDGMGSVVKFDQAPYKSVKLDGQVTTDEVKSLTVDELMAGGWCCGDVSEECRIVFAKKSLDARYADWTKKQGNEYCWLEEPGIVRSWMRPSLKQIHRIGNEFYWGEK